MINRSNTKRKGLGVSGRISVIVISLALAVFLITGFIISSQVTRIVEDLVKRELTLQAEKTSSEINAFLLEKAEISKLMSQTDSVMRLIASGRNITNKNRIKETTEYQNALKTIQNIKNGEDTIQLAYVALKDSNSIIANDTSIEVGDDYDLTTREWYVDAIEKTETSISEPYMDVATNKLVFSAITPLFNDDNDIGATVVDFSIDSLSDMLSTINIYKGNTVFITDSDGEVIYHPDKSNILNPDYSRQCVKIAIRFENRRVIKI